MPIFISEGTRSDGNHASGAVGVDPGGLSFRPLTGGQQADPIENDLDKGMVLCLEAGHSSITPSPDRGTSRPIA